MIATGNRPYSLEATVLMQLHRNGAAVEVRHLDDDDSVWEPRDRTMIGADFCTNTEYRLAPGEQNDS